MKELNLLIWLTQLGLSTALPLGSLLMLGIWLHKTIGWGRWTIWAGLVLGIVGAVNGFRDSLRAMDRMSRSKKPPEAPPVSFNNHD